MHHLSEPLHVIVAGYAAGAKTTGVKSLLGSAGVGKVPRVVGSTLHI